MSEFADFIARMVAANLQEDAAVVERACEEALAGGVHGVLVRRLNGVIVSAAPDANVPFGVIHELDEAAGRAGGAG